MSRSKLRRYGFDLHEHIVGTEKVHASQTGDISDILKTWSKLYEAKAWSKYASFDKKGGFNKPYCLFKAKNIVDPEIRKEKWKKARPISPGTKHPMRRLLGLAGRAWSFATKNMNGEHFILNSTGDVPEFLKTAHAELQKLGKVTAKVQDIEGCFPNMPKGAIRQAAREIANEHRVLERQGVWVPRNSKKSPCGWTQGGKIHNRVFIGFEVLTDVLGFSLDHTYLKMPDGRLLRQNLESPWETRLQ